MAGVEQNQGHPIHHENRGKPRSGMRRCHGQSASLWRFATTTHPRRQLRFLYAERRSCYANRIGPHSSISDDRSLMPLLSPAPPGRARPPRRLPRRWDELVAGPNGMGSALRSGAPAIVYGAEHYCERWQRWVCYGAPVRDPLHGGVLGVVNLTGWASKVRLNQLPLAMSLARSIEYILAPLRGSSRQALLEACRELRERFPSDRVFLCDDAGNAAGVSEELRETLARSGLRIADV